jgi:hypothetical protein
MCETNTPIACDLTVLQDHEQHSATIRDIFAAVQEVRELSNGYAFRLPAETDMLRHTMEFIANERLCCPFFTFGLELEAPSTTLWLSLSGGENVKEFIQAHFSALLSSLLAETLRAG